MIGRFRAPVVVEDDTPKGFDDFDLRLGDVMRGERATLGKSLLDIQRDLKIKASYIAAIENADPSAFETPGFIAGYVRSYARYLELDPDWAYRAFCAEGSFASVSAFGSPATARRGETRGDPDRRDPFASASVNFIPPAQALVSRIEPGALGSIAVLIALIGTIGYGGLAVLKEVQQVEFVPVEQTPVIAAELDPLAGAVAAVAPTEEIAGVIPKDPDGLDRLYRPQALDVPVMVARDGPIAALDPASVGALAPTGQQRALLASALTPPLAPAADAIDSAVTEALQAAGAETPTPRVVGDAAPEVVMLAVRPSWVRVQSADGTVIYERIMEAGDTYALPQTEDPAVLRTGNSGAIYFAVGGETYGPVGGDGEVTKNINLASARIVDAYPQSAPGHDADLERYVAELLPGN